VIEQLFGSKTRVKLLQLFFSNPNRSFYVREITRKIEEQINSVRRELSNLLSIGIIKSDANNNRLYYEVDQDYQHYQPLAMIFGGLALAAEAPVPAAKAGAKDKPAAKPAPVAATPAEPPMAKDIRALGNIELAVLTGQFTRDNSAGVDLLIVGDVNQTKVDHFVSELEKSEKKEIRFAVLDRGNYDYRLQVKDRFISNVQAAKKQVIIDASGLLGQN